MYSRLGEDVDKLKDTIRFEVSRGIANGSTWVEVGEQIANEMNSPFDIARNNAMRIARTEGHRVQEEAGLDAMRAAKEAGADVVKQWSATLDERTRPEHQEADGQIREIDEPFDVGGEELMMPGDGSAFNCINCRCTANMRARAALDESDLERLKERAKFYGLDKSKDFDDFKKKYLKSSEHLSKIAMDLQLFARKSKDFDTIRLSKKEYAIVMHEFNTNMSEDQRKRKIVSKAIGNYVYTIENNGFNDYRIIGKIPIEE